MAGLGGIMDIKPFTPEWISAGLETPIPGAGAVTKITTKHITKGGIKLIPLAAAAVGGYLLGGKGGQEQTAALDAKQEQEQTTSPLLRNMIRDMQTNLRLQQQAKTEAEAQVKQPTDVTTYQAPVYRDIQAGRDITFGGVYAAPSVQPTATAEATPMIFQLPSVDIAGQISQQITEAIQQAQQQAAITQEQKGGTDWLTIVVVGIAALIGIPWLLKKVKT